MPARRRKTQGEGAGLDERVQGEGAGLDEMVQGVGAGRQHQVPLTGASQGIFRSHQGNGGFQQTKTRGIGGKQNQAKDKGGDKKDIDDENLGKPKAETKDKERQNQAKGGDVRKDIGDDAHKAGTKAGVGNEDTGRVFMAAGVSADPDKIEHIVQAGRTETIEDGRSLLQAVAYNGKYGFDHLEDKSHEEATTPLRRLLVKNAIGVEYQYFTQAGNRTGEEGEDTCNDFGDFQQAGTKAGYFKTETIGAGDFETKTRGAGNFHQDGNRTGDRSKGIGDGAGDSYQDRTKFGDREGIGGDSQVSARQGHASRLHCPPRPRPRPTPRPTTPRPRPRPRPAATTSTRPRPRPTPRARGGGGEGDR